MAIYQSAQGSTVIMRKFGLTGYPLSHSFSKKHFEEKFKREGIADTSYDLYPLQSITLFPDLLKEDPQLKGLNITIPYKEKVMQYLQQLDDTAAQIGAVNCIKIVGRRLIGYNTDAYGFERSLEKFLTNKPEQAFILGSGGSAKAVKYVLQKIGVPYLVVSRNPMGVDIAYSEMEKKMKGSNLIINTTPLGMFPNIETSPEIPYDKLTKNDFLFDLLYNPEETIFLKKGKQHGAKTKNGFEMLQLQAEKSWEIWNR